MGGLDVAEELVRRALGGDPEALRSLVRVLTPVVQTRVARGLVRSSTGRRQGRDLRQDVEDFTQEVFASLFDDNARALRSWDPARGLSLLNFVGLVAEHQVASILRSGRRSPWTEEATADEHVASASTTDEAEERLHSRDLLERLLERLRAELSPRGLHLFKLLLVDGVPTEEVCAHTGLSADAIYAWRSRLSKRVRQLAIELESVRPAPKLVAPPRTARKEDQKAS